MKRTFFATLAIFAMFALTACTTLQADGTTTSKTPAQIAAQFCPSATIALTSLQSLQGISDANTTALADISNIVTPVCAAVAAGGQIQVTDLKTFASAYSPVLVAIVKASRLDPAKQNAILLDLAVAQIAISALPDPAPLAL